MCEKTTDDVLVGVERTALSKTTEHLLKPPNQYLPEQQRELPLWAEGLHFQFGEIQMHVHGIIHSETTEKKRQTSQINPATGGHAIVVDGEPNIIFHLLDGNGIALQRGFVTSVAGC